MNWIKIEVTTPDKPEVIMMAEELGIDQDAVVGKLFRLWIWADQNTVAGDAVRITEAFIDRLTGCPGLSRTMRRVGWLTGDPFGLTFPNFDRHNGASAKRRAMDNRLKNKTRELSKLNKVSDSRRASEMEREATVSAERPQDVRMTAGQNAGPEKRRLEKIKDLSTHTQFSATDQAHGAPEPEACVKSCETPDESRINPGPGSELERRCIEALGSRDEFDLAIQFARETRKAQNPLAWVWSIAKSGKPETGWPWTAPAPKARVRAAATGTRFQNDFPTPPPELCPLPFSQYRAKVQAMPEFGYLNWSWLESGINPLPAGVVPDPAPGQGSGTIAAQPLERLDQVPA